MSLRIENCRHEEYEYVVERKQVNFLSGARRHSEVLLAKRCKYCQKTLKQATIQQFLDHAEYEELDKIFSRIPLTNVIKTMG